MKLLHVDSSILGQHSVSRSLSANLVDRLCRKLPRLHVTYRDLAADPIPHLSGNYLAAKAGAMDASGDWALAEDIALGEQIMGEFLAADIVVIGVAFYNFSIPSQLKAWIDRIVVAGKTFRYSESGRVQGLAGSKRVFLAIARGGVYGEGSAVRAMEHAETYLRSAFSLIGVTHPEVIVAEGLKSSAEQRQVAIAQAELDIARTITAMMPREASAR